MATDRKFPPELRAFAITLHFYSSSAYNYIRNTFKKCLPHPNTLRKWYCSEQSELVCSLIMDEMSIRQHVDWNGTRSLGHVNFGHHIENDSIPLAKESLVFLVVGVNCRWKIPVAYFLIESLIAEQKIELMNGRLKSQISYNDVKYCE